MKFKTFKKQRALLRALLRKNHKSFKYDLSACACVMHITFTLSALQTQTNCFANSVDPNETAQPEPSHQDLHCLSLCSDFLLRFGIMVQPDSKMEESTSEVIQFKLDLEITK